MDDANIYISVEIDAEISNGIDKDKQRILIENANSVNFKEKKSIKSFDLSLLKGIGLYFLNVF